MLKKYGVLSCFFVIMVFLIYFSPGKSITPAEKMDILAGVGSDLVENNKYRMTISTYTFNRKDRISSMLLYASGNTISEAWAERQLKDNRKFISAFEKVVLFGEQLAQKGIRNNVDVMFANSFMNDMGWAVVCKGEAKDMLAQTIDGYASPADYIDGVVENSKEFNYFSDNYKLMDLYVRIEQEGRSIVLPYIEIDQGKPKISGLALFKKYKMVKATDIKEARIINMLREEKGRGNLDYIVNSKLFISSYGEVKRKIDCEKAGSKYVFNIHLNFIEDVVSNTLYKDLEKEPEAIKKYEGEIEANVKEKCEEFIKKMQNEYKIDCLELGKEACAKYGRGTGVDWDEAVSNAQINVDVKVKVRSLGRGRYAQ